MGELSAILEPGRSFGGGAAVAVAGGGIEWSRSGRFRLSKPARNVPSSPVARLGPLLALV